jgi:hypothetical protein
VTNLQKEGYQFKASIAWDYSCCPIHFNHIKSYYMCLSWMTLRIFLVFDLYLVTYGILHWVVLATAEHKLWSYNMINGIWNNTKRWYFNYCLKRARAWGYLWCSSFSPQELICERTFGIYSTTVRAIMTLALAQYEDLF